MYLKRIIASGFKSFADKINLELPSGITGIVGPNGSGKSNVVDAVRWVLGEQSVKSLRGDGNMADVIFSGSKSRGKMNVASVTLIFDNTDKYLPLEYNEVAIRRRVYRDGTNEYSINDQKCRLKDITDLLLDSGMAKESFNIISQGKIEEIINSKPVDRRIIFEEAAGVLKYKKRKDEALRKLERTHDNMKRVNDIIIDLEERINPLKDQRDKAIIYNSLMSKLENVEIALITSDITNLNYKYQSSKKRIEELNKEVLNISTNNTASEVKIEEYKIKLNKLNLEINNLQRELIENTTNVEKINSKKNILLERKKYDIDNTKLENNIIELKEKELKLKTDINVLQNEIKIKKHDIEDITNDYKSIEEEINRVKDSKNKQLNNLNSLIRNKTVIENKISYLRESIENNNVLPSSVKSVLNNPKLSGIHDVIGNLIEVDEKYANAITISLGLSSNNIVVDDEIRAKEAITYLKQNRLGRATFFPLNIIKAKFIDEQVYNLLNSLDGFLGIASKLVKFNEIYKNIIENQLGNVIVADNIDNANNISKIINHRYKIVTLDGELIHVGGSLTGGTISKNRNIITEKYDLETNILELDKIIADVKNIENELNNSDYVLKSLEDKMYIKSRDLVNAKEYVNNKNNMLEEYQEKLENIQSEMHGTNGILNNSLENEETKLLEEYYKAVDIRNNTENELNRKQKERDGLNEELANYESSVKKENSIYNQKSKELKDLEIEVNRIDVKMDTLLNKLNETYSMTYERAVMTYKLDVEEEIARQEVRNLKNEIKELGIVNIAAIDEYDQVKEKYDFLTNQKTDLINAENMLLEIISEMDEIMKKEFLETFKTIRENFITTFKELFKGGKADLELTDSSNLLETGIEIIASPPGKKLTSISLLSGGEKTFTAISLLFAILKSRPVPFCILDEVEAALDEVNVDSFGNYINGLKDKTQFILITHKKRTMEYVDVLYGITMQESGVSKLVSVKLEDIK